ncbi:baseplate assembly protein [Roseospira visakhapatnamensis]|uniref:Phage-related baseplate assembly protein n=1 Tax=Roseospira visakhapatnamensis TaxID=390880 RepID=A0A7W6RE52_9PROT|nr:baseplate J/gp47 family protein [Roseospira visakhapatnamensis]MBB4266889.1 phage-related baseplate assembly protein [Roseospira visakhapatnamensis]
MSRFDAIDLARLLAPDVLQAVDFEAELSVLLDEFSARYPEFSAALESEPVMKLTETVAYRTALKVAAFNDGARSLMLAHAGGTTLDHIAAAMGTARQEGEADDSLRARAQLAWEALSTAGPTGAYVYHALSADPRVRDVSVTSPVPGTVAVTVLSAEGDGSAPADLVAAVEAKVNADDVRPLTDTVAVQSAEVIPYGVAAVLTIADGPDPEVVRATAAGRLAATVAAAHRLGGTVSLSALYAALHVEGVRSVDLTEAQAIAAEDHQAPWCTSSSVTVGGGHV